MAEENEFSVGAKVKFLKDHRIYLITKLSNNGYAILADIKDEEIDILLKDIQTIDLELID